MASDPQLRSARLPSQTAGDRATRRRVRARRIRNRRRRHRRTRASAPHHRDCRRRRRPRPEYRSPRFPGRHPNCWTPWTLRHPARRMCSRSPRRAWTGRSPAEKHFRRARGRKVEVTLSDGSLLTGRLGETRDGAVHLVVPRGTRGTTPFASCRSMRSPKPLSRWSFQPRTSGSSSWPAIRGRGPEHEHRHGRTARHRGRQGHHGRRLARHHQVRAAHRLPPHRGPRGRRAHRDRPQDRHGPGAGARDRRRRQRAQRMGRHPRGFRPDRGHHRTPGHPAAAARRREREEPTASSPPAKARSSAGSSSATAGPTPAAWSWSGWAARRRAPRASFRRPSRSPARATSTATGCAATWSASAAAPANR